MAELIVQPPVGLADREVAGVGRDRLSVLAVTSELPWPLNSGGHLRSYHMLRALSRGHTTRVIAPLRPGEDESAERLRQDGWDLRTVAVGHRYRGTEARRVIAAAVRRQPYVMFRRHRHPEVLKALVEEIRRDPPDLLYLDHLDPLVFWDGGPPCRYVVDLHNVYSTLLARVADGHRGLKRVYLRREARLLDRVERFASERANALFCVSDDDAIHFRDRGARSIRVIPNGVDCGAYAHLPAGRPAARPTVLFLGAMSWAPNAAAAVALARDHFPHVRKRHPDARLWIVGRDPTAEVQALAALPGVEVTGGVPSVMPYLAEASVLAVPLDAGGGTRLKILEAFAAGLPVVSTPIGCEGLDVAHAEHLLVATGSQFGAALCSALDEPEMGARLADRARRLVRARFDWQAITDRACAILQNVVRQ